LKDGTPYKVHVEGTFKDFETIKFEALIDYNVNLDGKSKFVDLGSHIFTKNS
jgi:hypothetical protein